MNGSPSGVMNEIHAVTSMEGHWARLRPVSRADYPKMFQWRVDLNMVHLWNISRRTGPSFEEFVAETDQGARNGLLLVIIDRASDQLIGYAQQYNTNFWDRWAYLAAYLVEEFRGQPHFPETMLMSMDALFKWFPLNKIYGEVYEFAQNLHQLLPALGFVEEGYVPDHFWHNGRSWGLTRWALYRERWPEARERLVDILRVREQFDKEAAPMDSRAQ